MIKIVKLKNIKCFLNVEFELSPLTVFCGANSAGKSTIIQSLLLLKQSYDTGKLVAKKINLSGRLFSMGKVVDMRAQRADSSQVSIEVDEFLYESIPLSNKYDHLYDLPLNASEVKIHQFLREPLYYLNAYRLPPQTSYDINVDSEQIDIGIYGEYTMSVLEQLQAKPVINQELAQIIWSLLEEQPNHNLLVGDIGNSDHSSLYMGKDIETSAEFIEERAKITTRQLDIKESVDQLQQYNLGVTVKKIMRKISSGFDIKLIRHSELDKVSNSFGSHDATIPVRPVNTGFGISYVLPIIVAALCAKKGATLIVENPEVHLHPSAQAELAKFLAYTSLTGVQVILETHSDHIINGIRVFAKNKQLTREAIVINNIRLNSQKDKIITPIRINKDGNLSSYEDGFFDQITKDLMRLFE